MTKERAAFRFRAASGQRRFSSAAMKRSFCPPTTFHGSIAFPFVIPSEAEGSAVQRISLGNVFGDMGQVKV
jgi:hypothetical protein